MHSLCPTFPSLSSNILCIWYIITLTPIYGTMPDYWRWEETEGGKDDCFSGVKDLRRQDHCRPMGKEAWRMAVVREPASGDTCTGLLGNGSEHHRLADFNRKHLFPPFQKLKCYDSLWEGLVSVGIFMGLSSVPLCTLISSQQDPITVEQSPPSWLFTFTYLKVRAPNSEFMNLGEHNPAQNSQDQKAEKKGGVCG